MTIASISFLLGTLAFVTAALNLGLVAMSLGIGWIAVWFFVSSSRIPAGDRDAAADDRLVGTSS